MKWYEGKKEKERKREKKEWGKKGKRAGKYVYLSS